MSTIFLLWISLFPFVMLYGAYEGPKVFWLWGGGFFLTVFWIIRILKSSSIDVSKESGVFIVWLIVFFGASIGGIHPVQSILGGSYRHQGVLFFFTLVLVMQTIHILPHVMKTNLMKWFAISVIVESIIIIFEKLFHFSVRPLGTIGEPNAVAGFLAVGLYSVCEMRYKRKWLRDVLCFIILCAILSTGSRTGIVTAGIVLSGYLLPYFKDFIRSNHLKKTVIGIGSVITLALVFVVWQGMVRPSSPHENRVLFASIALKEIAQQPLLGFGAESGEAVYDRAFTADNIRRFDFIVDRSHNLFLDVCLWSGVFGLFVFCYWLILIGRRLYIIKDWFRLTAFVGWLVFASFQPVGVVHWVSLIMIL
jgi:O-antigen ligase